MEQDSEADAEVEIAFRGYAPPTSSTTYTPNQFFDFVLPNSSRGCLRLVAYIIRKTLGWSDANGNPQNPTATISYRELERCAGIGRGRVKEAIDEAIASQFIECLRFGKPHQAGDEGYSALYGLKWGRQDRYVTDRDEFDGFFAGNGNLSHIPNEFFDHTIPRETLAVVKIVGVIIRNTIGFQTKFGFRRQEAALSFSDIMRRAGIGSRTTVSGAIKAAIDGKHIRVVTQGIFDTNAGLESKAAIYGVNWSDEYPMPSAARLKTPRRRRAIVQGLASDGHKSATAPELDRGESSQTGPGDTSGTGLVSVPNQDRKEPQNWTANKTTSLNNSSKQHQSSECRTGEPEAKEVISALLAQGIEERTVERLVMRYPREQIVRQLAWIPLRHVNASRTGLLIRAIEHDMAAPVVTSEKESLGGDFAAHYYAEIGGNPNVPLAVPSGEEARLATHFLSTLGAAESPSKVGRAFARYVIGRCQSGRFMPHSLALALRLHADSFSMSKRSAKRTDMQSRKDARRASLESEYRSFVQSEIRKLFDDVALREVFEKDIATRLESCRRLSERGFEMLRGELDSEEGRFELFGEFIAKHHAGLIPDFRKWDETVNRERLGNDDLTGVQRIRA